MKTQILLEMGLGVLCTANAMAQNNRPPHVILLMTDQQRFDALGCAGNPAILTPNLDKLSQDGNMFMYGYSSCPSSTPARAGLVTGMSPWKHGLLGYGDEAERYENEFPRVMKDLGYYAVGVGKMHWYPQWNKRGLDVLLSDESGRKYSENYMTDYRKWFALHAGGKNPDITGIGWNDHGASLYKLPEELHPTTWTGETAVEMINNYEGDKPMYLKVSFARPHSPYDPPKRFYDMYANLPEPSAPAMGDWIPEEWKSKTNPKEDRQAAIGNFGDEYAKNSRRYYYASVTFVDEQLGHVIDALKKKGMYDNAIIFFVSDHGDMMGDHCMWRKTYAYEGSTHVPFIVKLPKGIKSCYAKGEKIMDKVVELRDVLPTAIDIANGKQPEAMDGESLLPIFENRDAEWREYLDLEHSAFYFDDSSWCALTDGNMKYVYFYNTGGEQFFDLKKDPYEEKDLVKVKKYKKDLVRFRQAMVEHLSVRGEDWVKNGELQIIKKPTLYGKNFPYEGNPYKRPAL